MDAIAARAKENAARAKENMQAHSSVLGGLDGNDMDSDEVLRVATLNVDQGLRAKLVPILQWALLAGVQVLALQETGNYAKDHSLLRHLGWHMIMSSTAGGGGTGRCNAGVCLLIRHDLNIRTVKEFDGASDDIDGRLVGALLQSSGGCKTLIVSAYLPTAMDLAPDDGMKARTAKAIYSKILSWSSEAEVDRARGKGGPKTIVLGDLNETLTTADRVSFSSVSSSALSLSSPLLPHSRRSSTHPRFVSALINAHFVDTYRSLHDEHGFTCRTKHGMNITQSRIDYVLTHGFTSGEQHVVRAEVLDPPARLKTRHRILVVDLRHDIAASTYVPPSPPRSPMPDMRRASRDEKEAMVGAMEEWVQQNEKWIFQLANGSREDISLLGQEIIDAACRAARCLPSSGGLRGRSKRRCALQRRRRNLCSLRNLLVGFIHRHAGVIPWSSLHLVSLRVARCRDDVKPLGASRCTRRRF